MYGTFAPWTFSIALPCERPLFGDRPSALRVYWDSIWPSFAWRGSDCEELDAQGPIRFPK